MDKPIPEAVELLRAFQSQFGARRPDEDEDDAETWDRIDAVCKSLTAAQQQAVATPLPGDKGSVQALFNPTLQPMQQGGGEINMDVTVRDGAWVGTYAEWCRRKQDTPPSAPVGVEDVVMAARNAENAIRNCAAAGQIGEGYVQYADDLRDAVQRLAQQPAAVDEAYPTPRNRAEAVALAKLALAHLGVIDAHIDAAIARCETDLATQHQEPKS